MPLLSWNSIFHSDIIITQSTSYSLQSWFPILTPTNLVSMIFDIEIEDLPTKPRHTFQLTQSNQSLKSMWLTLQHKQCPIKALSVVPQLTPNDNPIIPIAPINPLFPPHLQPNKPYNLGEDIKELGMWMRFVGIEDCEPQYYMDTTGIEFAMWVTQA